MHPSNPDNKSPAPALEPGRVLSFPQGGAGQSSSVAVPVPSSSLSGSGFELLSALHERLARMDERLEELQESQEISKSLLTRLLHLLARRLPPG